jgi:hypothetical protein
VELLNWKIIFQRHGLKNAVLPDRTYCLLAG